MLDQLAQYCQEGGPKAQVWASARAPHLMSSGGAAGPPSPNPRLQDRGIVQVVVFGQHLTHGRVVHQVGRAEADQVLHGQVAHLHPPGQRGGGQPPRASMLRIAKRDLKIPSTTFLSRADPDQLQALLQLAYALVRAARCVNAVAGVGGRIPRTQRRTWRACCVPSGWLTSRATAGSLQSGCRRWHSGHQRQWERARRGRGGCSGWSAESGGRGGLHHGGVFRAWQQQRVLCDHSSCSPLP